MAESMKGLKRTHRCAELSAANVGEKVTIMGWVQKNRNKGGLVFVDVRDRSGIIQVVFEEGKSEAALIEKAAKLRAEYVVAIVGTVAKRSGAVNDHLATGEIEVLPEELRILSESETPPFHIEENSKTKEEVRLKYRYLDLRKKKMQDNLTFRHKLTKHAPIRLNLSIGLCTIQTCQKYENTISKNLIEVAGPAFSNCKPRLIQYYS